MATTDADRRELAALVRRLALLPSVLFATLAGVLVWEYFHGDEAERAMHIALAVMLLAGLALSGYTVRQVRRLSAVYERAVAAREQFLSIASHELKTPLTSLQLQLQSLVRAAGGDARTAPKLQSASRSAERLGELVDRLLDVSRADSRPMEISPEEADLGDIARSVAARFADALEESGSTLSLALGEPVRGRWDRMRLDTVVSNLLSNAIKYGEGKPIELGVSRAGPLARIWVRDRGIGVAPDDHQRIFERFERAVPERHYGGFGIGLWVARLVAEAHGGRIRVQSQPAEGSTFVVELPLEEEPR
jgi:signal transduction histidine kinase